MCQFDYIFQNIRVVLLFVGAWPNINHQIVRNAPFCQEITTNTSRHRFTSHYYLSSPHSWFVAKTIFFEFIIKYQNINKNIRLCPLSNIRIRYTYMYFAYVCIVICLFICLTRIDCSRHLLKPNVATVWYFLLNHWCVVFLRDSVFLSKLN